VKKRFARLKNFLGHRHAFQLKHPFKQLHFNANPSHQNSILLLLPWYHKQMVFTKLFTKTMSALLKQEVNLLSHGPLCHGADTFCVSECFVNNNSPWTYEMLNTKPKFEMSKFLMFFKYYLTATTSCSINLLVVRN
jgi:hypothetical protein